MPITEAFKQKLMKAIKGIHDDQTIEVSIKIEVVDSGQVGKNWFFKTTKPRPMRFKVTVVDLDGTEVIPLSYYDLKLDTGDTINISGLRSAFDIDIEAKI